MSTSPRAIKILFTLVMLWSLGSRVAVFGQEITLALPEDDRVQNSAPVSCIAFSPDGNLVATGHGMNLGLLQEPSPGQTILWDRRSGKRLRSIRALKDGVHSVAFSPDGKTLADLDYSGIIRLIDVAEWREIRTLGTNREEIEFYAFAFFPNGKNLAAGRIGEIGASEGEILFLDITSGRRIRSLAGHDGTVFSLAISPDGKLLASGGDDGTVKIWDALPGKLLQTLTFPSLRKDDREDKPEPWVQSVTVSPDGRSLAAAASVYKSAAVIFWDLSTAKLRATLREMDPNIRQLMFSPNGRRLLTAGSDGATKIWDIRTFKQVGKIPGCYPVAFSPDGNAIAGTVDVRTVIIRRTPNANIH